MPAAGLRMARVSDRLLLLITVYYSLGQHLGEAWPLLAQHTCMQAPRCVQHGGRGGLGCFKP